MANAVGENILQIVMRHDTGPLAVGIRSYFQPADKFPSDTVCQPYWSSPGLSTLENDEVLVIAQWLAAMIVLGGSKIANPPCLL